MQALPLPEELDKVVLGLEELELTGLLLDDAATLEELGLEELELTGLLLDETATLEELGLAELELAEIAGGLYLAAAVSNLDP